MDYQAWTSAEYNWLDKTTATSAPLQINDKLVAWVAAVNANASNATKQITIEKGPANSTSTNYVGWVIKLASASSGSTFYASFFSNSTAQATVSFDSGWTAGTGNGGYGAFTAPSSSIPTAYFYTSGQAAEFAIGSETENGKEFFCLAWKASATANYSGTFLVFKDSNGEWAGYTYTTSNTYGTFYLPTNTTPRRQYGVVTASLYSSSNNVLDPFALKVTSTTYLPAAGSATTLAVSAASQNLLIGEGASLGYLFGRYCTLPGPTTAVCMGASPVFVRY
jgi:hypothetical protein